MNFLDIKNFIDTIRGFKISVEGTGINISLNYDINTLDNFSDYNKSCIYNIISDIIRNIISDKFLNYLIDKYCFCIICDTIIDWIELEVNHYYNEYIFNGGIDIKEELYDKINQNKEFFKLKYNLI